MKPLHEQAIKVLRDLLAKLNITISDIDLSKEPNNLLWIHTYPQVCNAIGIVERSCSDAYSYELGNGEQYDEAGQLFTFIVLAVNEPDAPDARYFWIEFVFQNNNTVRIEIGSASPHSEYCDSILEQITEKKRGSLIPPVEATDLIIKLHLQLKEDRECFTELC